MMKDKNRIQMERFNFLLTEIDAVYHEAALKLGLSDSAMLILYTVCSREGACPLNDITRTSGVSKQTINSALRKLEAEEIVCLETMGARRKRVCLTEKGKRLAERTVFRLIEAENEILGSWSEDEQMIYMELTQRYLNLFKEKIKEM